MAFNFLPDRVSLSFYFLNTVNYKSFDVYSNFEYLKGNRTFKYFIDTNLLFKVIQILKN